MIALLSDMNQPLGFAVGNALELKEAIKTFHGDGPADFVEHSLIVAGHLLALGGVASDEKQGYQMAQKALEDGRGWERFLALVSAQHGDTKFVENPDLLPTGSIIHTVRSPRSGYIRKINARTVGEGAVMLGAGRAKKEDAIDHGVGIVLHYKVGDIVKQGDALFTIYANNESHVQQVQDYVLNGYCWSNTPVESLPLIYGIVK